MQEAADVGRFEGCHTFSLRRTALTNEIPYYTTIAGARAAVQAIIALKTGSLAVAPLQSYFEGPF